MSRFISESTPKISPSAAHIEDELLANLRTERQLYATLLDNVQRFRCAVTSTEDHRILGKVLQGHVSRQRTNFGDGQELEWGYLFQERDYGIGDDRVGRELR